MPMYNDGGTAVNRNDLTSSIQNLPGGITVRLAGRLRCICGRTIKAYDLQVHDGAGSAGIKDVQLICPGCHQSALSIEGAS